MKLLLTIPTEVVLDEAIEKVVAESETGSFCLLPRHLDMATVLVPGLLVATRPDGAELVVAVDHGVLVKVGGDVRVTCQRAFVAQDADDAARAVRERFRATGEREKHARAVLARLETDVVRRLADLSGRHGT